MKTDTRHRTTFGTRFRFLVRVLALFGVLAVAAGAVVAVPSFPPPAEWNVENFKAAAQGEKSGYEQTAALLLLGGAAALALWFLVELLSALTLLTGRKTATGTNAAVQVALATALLVTVNALSFQHYKRWDRTRDGEFTLAPELRDKLAKLDPRTPTTIVALRVHKTASVAPDRSDNYDAAAERKVVEKVRDLTDVIRELGPTFDVRVVDIEDEDYSDRVDALAGPEALFARGLDAEWDRVVASSVPAKNGWVRRRLIPEQVRKASAAFTAAIEGAPENSIFFAANGKFQRMAFNEFLLYDKTASKAEGKDRSERNLVLVPQGTDKFVGKLLALEERKPVVGVAVVHTALSASQDDGDDISMIGMRRVLERNGYSVKDVILKNWGRELTPAARTVAEDEFVELENEYNLNSLAVASIESAIREREKAATDAAEFIKKMDAALAAADRAQAIKQLEGAIEVLQEYTRRRILTDRDAKAVLDVVRDSVPTLKGELTNYRERLDEVRPKYEAALKNDKLLEARRAGDIRTRMKAFVESCDILVVPRLTVMQLVRRRAIQAWLHNVNGDQLDVIREFVAAGKPVLFTLGSTSPDGQRPGREQPDKGFDDLLGRFGITLGSQAIFTDAEGKAVASATGDGFNRRFELPSLDLNVPPPDGKPRNPVAEAFLKSGRLVDGKLPILRSGFRPIYLSDQARARLPYSGVLARTVAGSWNEDRPIAEPEDDYTPRFTVTKLDDPAKGTRDEKRRGPFDVGVALEAPIPLEWLETKPAAAEAGAVVAGSLTLANLGFPVGFPLAGLPPESFKAAATTVPTQPTVRLVVLGHGGLFTGPKIDAGEEALLLHTLNWQLRRDDKLPQGAADGKEWKYPRVKLDPVQKAAWTGGAVALLPLGCAVLGVIVLMVRRFR